MLKVLRTVGEAVGMLRESERAVVDLPKVMGREVVCRDSFGRPWAFNFGALMEGETTESMVEELEGGVCEVAAPGSGLRSHTREEPFEAVEGPDGC